MHGLSVIFIQNQPFVVNFFPKYKYCVKSATYITKEIIKSAQWKIIHTKPSILDESSHHAGVTQPSRENDKISRPYRLSDQ